MSPLSANAPAVTTTLPKLPIIDISGLGQGDAARDADIAGQIRQACLDKGFLYVVGHGVPPQTLEDMRTAAQTFFDLPLDEKLAIAMANSPANRGYEPLSAQTLEEGAPPDQKESVMVGVDLSPDDPRVQAGKFNHGPNQWPAKPDTFKPAALAYFAHMTALGARLMKGLALSLDLPETYFDGFTTDPMCNLRLLHYPPQRANAQPDEKGCGAHTDFGGLTLLWQDDVGGLEVLDPDAGWIPAPPIPGAYVVNLGDMIARWTNGRYRSTMHRVINRSGRERYSIPFFYTGNPDHEVRCIESCLAPGQTPSYPPITVAGHIQAMYAKTYKT